MDHETIPLTPKGAEQASLVAGSFDQAPDLIVASPFSRAQATAMETVDAFPLVSFETWPIHEFTYLEPARCINTTVAQRRSWVEAYWAKADPAFIDGEGAAKAGEVDNRAYAAALGYVFDNGHSVMATYQVMGGATGFPYINNPYLPNYVQYHDFGSAGERSWQLRYGYDFAAMGIPGLSFFTAYIRGDGLKTVGAEKEWERDVDVNYAFQGSLKGFSVRLRNATYRSDAARDIDETRLIASYLFTSF